MRVPSVSSDHSSRLRALRAQRRAREKEARRQSILDAAAAVFLDRGISATTMDQIAERAELSKAAVYLYFSSKEELCLALLVHASRPLNDTLEAARDPAAPLFEQLLQLIRAYYAFYRQRPDYFRLIFVLEHPRNGGKVADGLRAEWTALGREGIQILADVIATGIKQGVIRRCDPWKTAVAFWAALTGVIVLPAQEIRWDFLGHLDQEELLLSTAQNFWTGIQAAGAAGKGSPRLTSRATNKRRIRIRRIGRERSPFREERC